MMGLVSRVAVEPCSPTICLTGLAQMVSLSVDITTSGCYEVVKIYNAFNLMFNAYCLRMLNI
jgi:hypothetical protein